MSVLSTWGKKSILLCHLLPLICPVNSEKKVTVKTASTYKHFEMNWVFSEHVSQTPLQSMLTSHWSQATEPKNSAGKDSDLMEMPEMYYSASKRLSEKWLFAICIMKHSSPGKVKVAIFPTESSW